MDPIDEADAMAERPRVLVYRGDMVESRHRISFAIADAAGRILHARGKVDRPVFPRSAIKMLQAIPLVASGAADRFGVTPAELALACASHNGEPRHADAVAVWLSRLGYSFEDLECGSHVPIHTASAQNLARGSSPPLPLHNNCSGKHAGMLTLARHMDVDPKGYIRPNHPVQRVIGQTLSAMTGVAALPEPGIDGCGIPTFALPLTNLAKAMATFADPANLNSTQRAACRRLATAMVTHPEMVAGEGRACTTIMKALPEVAVKVGAEGVYTAALTTSGLGIALKVEDGADRAASVAMMALLDRLGVVDEIARKALKDVATPVLKNHARTLVGRIEPAPGWPDLAIAGSMSGDSW